MSLHLRAPLCDGEVLLHPAQGLDALAGMNEQSLSTGALFDRPLAEVRAETRVELAPLAERWTSAILRRPGETARRSALWIVSGHQPEFFHPGVWVKTAVLAGLARNLSAESLNLVVDTDLSASSSITLPGRHAGDPAVHIPWDHARPTGPWEERPAPHPATFTTFGERCREALAAWGWEPLASQLAWDQGPNLPIVDRLVTLRHQAELALGIDGRELKSSAWAETRSFRWLTWHLLNDAAHFRVAYNTSLEEYRHENQIRSRSHPVPPLDSHGPLIEAPLWAWRAGETQRGRLFVEAIGGQLRLSDGQREIGYLPCLASSRLASAEAAFTEMAARGWKLRPRALLTTLAMRICVASVLIHGIGGAKYDELTDRIIASYFHRTPPKFIVATATLRLFELFAEESLSGEIHALRGKLRQSQWNPECLVEAGSPVEELITEKRCLTHSGRREGGDRAERATRHRRIQEINVRLQAELAERHRMWADDLATRLAQRPCEQTLRSREYPAILFPQAAIHGLFVKAMDALKTT